MAEFTVRFAEEADSDWCVFTATAPSEDFLRVIPGVNETFVAVSSGERVGMLHLTYMWPWFERPTPFMSLIHVIGERRREGIGRGMLAFVERNLQQNNQTLLLRACKKIND